MIRDGLLENATKMGTMLLDGLRDIQNRYPLLGDVRGLGLMIGTEFTLPDGSPAVDLAKQIIARCQAERLLLLSAGTYGNTIRWIPPLIVTPEQIAWSLAIFERALQAVG